MSVILTFKYPNGTLITDEVSFETAAAFFADASDVVMEEHLVTKSEPYDWVEVPWPRFRIECPKGAETTRHRFYEVKK